MTFEETNGHSVTFIDPRGVEWVVTNVEEFVREHYEQFDSDDDVKPPEHLDGRKHGTWTRADRGLRAVAEGRHEQWKGWRLK